MSSNKKLRLDHDSQPQDLHSTSLPGGSGRFLFENSSLSSSGSAGNYTRGRTSGPFRTKYSGRPMDIASSSSFSRFAPYHFGKDRRSSLRVPLIRARRDESDQEGMRPSSRHSWNSSLGGDSTASATSSTAQRIIETLQNLSTPVLNAGKIRIDQDIKAVQPLSFGRGSQVSGILPVSPFGRSTGPPKMCSSLLLSNPSPATQTSPLDPRRVFSIPKMVDAATNTDKESANTLPSPQTSVASKLGQERMTSVATTFSVPSKTAAKDDNSDDEFHECSSDFTFSSAWSPEIFERYFASDRDKSTQSRQISHSASQQQPMLNGFKESPPATTTTPIFNSTSASSIASLGKTSTNDDSLKSVANTSFASPTGFTGFQTMSPSGAGTTLTSLTKDTSFPLKEVAGNKPVSEEKTGGLSTSAGISSGKFSTFKPLPDSSTASSASSFVSSFSMSKADALKPTFSFGSQQKLNVGSNTFDKVDASKSTESGQAVPKTSSVVGSAPDLNSTLGPLTVVKSSSKWRCPDCCIENDIHAANCVCCTAKNPAAAPASKPVVKKWRCPDCAVENEPDVGMCVCCTAKNPSLVDIPVVKKWRCPTCMVENDPAIAACVCCSEKNPNSVSSEKKNVEAASLKNETPTFKFGVPSATTFASSNTSTPVFGKIPSNTQQSSPAPTFKFGAPSAPPVATTTTSAATTTTTSLASSTTTFKFGAPAEPSPSASSQSASVPVSTFGFGTINKTDPPVLASTLSSSGGFPALPKTATDSSNSILKPPGGAFGSGISSFTGQPASQSATTGGPFSFGSSTEPQKQTFSFGGASAKPAFGGTFSLGGSQQTSNTAPPINSNSSILAQSQANPLSATTAIMGASTTAPSTFSFGSSNSNPVIFGQIQSSNNQMTSPSPAGLFQFGAPPSNPQNPVAAPTATSTLPPTFSFTPNLNLNFSAATPGTSIPFGNPSQPTPAAGSQPPPPLFNISSNSSTVASRGRVIKRAVRRNK